MQTLSLLGRNIKVDTDNIATGLKNIDPNIHIGMGVFNGLLMDATKDSIRTRVNQEFTADDRDSFKTAINNFVSECMHEITVKLMK